jgi:hypothetical protein
MIGRSLPRLVSGSESDILCRANMHLSQALLDEAWEKRLGRPLASRGYTSVWAGVEIWSKLDRFARDTEILRLELVIN